MLAQPAPWFILLAFICVIGPLIFIHELGHYLVAKLFGVGAEEFSIGFGREIFGWTDRSGTRWKVGWLPLGGFVRFVGDENAASAPADAASVPERLRKRSFHLKPVWQRFMIVLAGPVANFLLAIAIIAAFIAIYGVASTPNLVTGTVKHSAAEAAGLKPGDRIVSISGRATKSFEQIAQLASLYPDQDVRVGVDRNGHVFDLNLHFGAQTITDQYGQKFRIGLLGIPTPPVHFERVPALMVVPVAVQRTAFLTRSMMAGLWQIISGRRSLEEIGGPLRIARIAGQQAQLGWGDYVVLLALLSINLGFINLLPVPVLDGGHLFLYAIEAVRRRPVSLQVQDWAFRGGFALVLAFLLLVTFNDLGSFGLWERLGRLIG